MRGHIVKEETKIKLHNRLKGRIISQEHLNKIHEGRKKWWDNMSSKDKQKYNLSRSGEKHPLWKGGLTKDKNWQNKNRREWTKKNSNNWKLFFLNLYGINPKCEICGVILNWNGYRKTSVNFDHNKTSNIVKYNPSQWYRGHTFKEKNKNIFLEHNFGILCASCNAGLPTSNRIQWLENALIYARRELEKRFKIWQ